MTLRLTQYLEDGKILNDAQHGFKRNCSTITALESVKSYIEENINHNKIVCMIAIDIKNAFGSVGKFNILNVLMHYNVPSKIKKFFDSYLSNRSILVSDNDYIENNVDVPQGSSFGPILWLLIINTLLDRWDVNDFKIVVYADNITILLNATAIYHFTNRADKPLKLIADWCTKYGLECSINK